MVGQQRTTWQKFEERDRDKGEKISGKAAKNAYLQKMSEFAASQERAIGVILKQVKIYAKQGRMQLANEHIQLADRQIQKLKEVVRDITTKFPTSSAAREVSKFVETVVNDISTAKGIVKQKVSKAEMAQANISGMAELEKLNKLELEEAQNQRRQALQAAQSAHAMATAVAAAGSVADVQVALVAAQEASDEAKIASINVQASTNNPTLISAAQNTVTQVDGIVQTVADLVHQTSITADEMASIRVEPTGPRPVNPLNKYEKQRGKNRSSTEKF